jgi:GDP-4-dehydro-6-deoxy-D-mannose reductase
MQKKVFITGISGFAGSHLARHLVKSQNYSVSGTFYAEDSLPILSDIRDAINCIQADLTNKAQTEAIIKEQKPDFIFHLAALTSPAQSFKNPLATITDNVAMQINLLEAIKTYELMHTRILIISSADVYGVVSQSDLPIDEQTPFRPTNPYAVSKITQDYLALQYTIAHDLEIIRVRPFNHIGSGQSAQFVVSAFAKQIAEIEKGKKEPILRVGNIETKRDFTDVRDMVKAYGLILEKGDIGEVYNIGTGKAYKISDILDILLHMSTTQIDVKIDETLLRPSDTPELLCDNTKFVSKTGWRAEYSIEETLQTILDYWRKIV